jgi:hypothetical protein
MKINKIFGNGLDKKKKNKNINKRYDEILIIKNKVEEINNKIEILHELNYIFNEAKKLEESISIDDFKKLEESIDDVASDIIQDIKEDNETVRSLTSKNFYDDMIFKFDRKIDNINYDVQFNEKEYYESVLGVKYQEIEKEAEEEIEQEELKAEMEAEEEEEEEELEPEEVVIPEGKQEEEEELKNVLGLGLGLKKKSRYSRKK